MDKVAKWIVLLGLLLVLISAETSHAANSSAIYNLTFTSVWSPASHDPNTLPLPAGAHWSRLIGATHNNSATFWQVGNPASNGIRRMAESGADQPFHDEVTAAITAGNTDQWVQFPAILASAAGTRNHTITVNDNFPYLTLVSMIAPSPDWFVGVDTLALQTSNGDWKPSITTDLYIYDAGTDAGTLFASPNNADLGHPISNKHGATTFTAAPIGTLTLTRHIPTAVNLTTVQATQQIARPFFFGLLLVATATYFKHRK